MKTDASYKEQERSYSEYFPGEGNLIFDIFVFDSFLPAIFDEAAVSSPEIGLHNNFNDDVFSRMAYYMYEEHFDALNDNCE